jgi:branched-chain amino acid transport system substrate-binding protein
MCFLAAVAAGSADPAAIREKVRAVTKEGAPKFTVETLADAIKAAQSGQPIDYVGASGEMRFGQNGDPVAGLYDVFTYSDGKRTTVKQVVAK